MQFSAYFEKNIFRLVRTSEEDSSENNSLYVYRTYLDRRGKSPKLRVLAFNKCHKKRLVLGRFNKIEFSSVLSAKIGDDWQPLKPTPMFKSCPESWSPGCSLVGYFHETVVDERFSANEVSILETKS